jgi:hypothetical protein
LPPCNQLTKCCNEFTECVCFGCLSTVMVVIRASGGTGEDRAIARTEPDDFLLSTRVVGTSLEMDQAV